MSVTDWHEEVMLGIDTETQARAERRIRDGKRLVTTGFVVAVTGIVSYCLVNFSAAEAPVRLVAPTLGLIGLGTLLWLVGSILYLLGGMDSTSGEDLYL